MSATLNNVMDLSEASSAKVYQSGTHTSHALQAKVVRRELQGQRGAARSQAAAVDHCILCWDSNRRHTRLALAAAQTCYLALPQR